MSEELKRDGLVEVDVNKLKSYSRHVYNEYTGKKLEDMVSSVKEHGVLESILVRPIEDEDFDFEIISGHNRVKAAKRAGLEKIPAQVKEMTDAEADIRMVESNSMRRTEILPVKKEKHTRRTWLPITCKAHAAI